MGEPRRWTIRNTPSLGGPRLPRGESVRVRENRATDAEKAKIAAWLEERYGAPVRDHIGEWGGHEEWGADARELLGLLVSELTEPQMRALGEIEKMPLGSASTLNLVVLGELATAGLIRVVVDLSDRGREVLADA